MTSHLTSQYDPLPRWEVVTVVPSGEAAPSGAERLGEVMVGMAPFVTAKQGTVEKETDLVKRETRSAGGNLLQITEIREPDETYPISRIKADITAIPL